ncbi:MAG TPA: hypothetical protein PLO93_01345 [Candidatus Omnitrophota bacterium]|nr:hypothetical protein [Candidatus Omnitrophota bacterium]
MCQETADPFALAYAGDRGGFHAFACQLAFECGEDAEYSYNHAADRGGAVEVFSD